MVKKSVKLEGLNALRFFAFFWIFCSHIFPKTTASHNLLIQFLVRLNYFGFWGVDLFFVLSSFLLTYLGLAEKAATHNFSIKNFLIRRSLRIFPLYYLIIATSFLILPVIGRLLSNDISLPTNYWLYLFFLSNYEHSNSIFALKFLWSIAVEEQFYWSWAFLLLIFQKKFGWVAVILLAAYCLIFFVLYPAGIKIPDNTILYLANFSLGSFFAILFFNFRKYAESVSLSMTIFFVFGLGYFFIPAGNHYLDQLFRSAFFASLLIFCIAICEIRFIKNSIMYKMLDDLGTYTYGLYVYSGFAITFVGYVFIRNSLLANPFIIFLLDLTIVMVAAITSYKLYEIRFLKYSQRFKWKAAL